MREKITRKERREKREERREKRSSIDHVLIIKG